jgi:hypothetical protein
MLYDLSCTDCSFTTVIEGDDRDVYEAIDTHQAETADSHSEHFVNFQARLTESETAQP